MIDKVKNFFNEARQEFRHVNWPTRQEAVKLTAVVIGISLGLGIFLGVFDGVFQFLLKTFISK
ncbi:MAG: preprotein translocase subunit SecE [Candidatus Liptonbacteria bacterium]|nr:preprotein translocase subunit SecE [Candidatus Liptonbacteria bacterium]